MKISYQQKTKAISLLSYFNIPQKIILQVPKINDFIKIATFLRIQVKIQLELKHFINF